MKSKIGIAMLSFNAIFFLVWNLKRWYSISSSFLNCYLAIADMPCTHAERHLTIMMTTIGDPIIVNDWSVNELLVWWKLQPMRLRKLQPDELSINNWLWQMTQRGKNKKRTQITCPLIIFRNHHPHIASPLDYSSSSFRSLSIQNSDSYYYVAGL